MNTARVRVRMKGTTVYLLPPIAPSSSGDLRSAARSAADRNPLAWALVTFWTSEDGKHGSSCRYDWPAAAGPVHLMPAAVAERLRETIFSE